MTKKETKKLKLLEFPYAIYLKNGYVYDEVRLEDDKGKIWYYRGIDCTIGGNPSNNQSKFLVWALKSNINDSVIVKGVFKDNMASRLQIIKIPKI